MDRVKKYYKKYGISKGPDRLQRLHQLASQNLEKARDDSDTRRDIKMITKPTLSEAYEFFVMIYPEHTIGHFTAEKWHDEAPTEFWGWLYQCDPPEVGSHRSYAPKQSMWDDMLKHKEKRFEKYMNACNALVKTQKETLTWYKLVSYCEKAECIESAKTFRLSHRAISALKDIINNKQSDIRTGGKDGCRFLRIAVFSDDDKLLKKLHIQRDTGKHHTNRKDSSVSDVANAFIITTACSKRAFGTLGVIDPKRRICTIKADQVVAQKLQSAMEEFSEDPKKFMETVGKKMGECCMCGRPLSDEESKERGFGPICYKWIQTSKMVREESDKP